MKKNKIIATLKYGRHFSNFHKVLFALMIMLMFLLICTTILILQSEDYDSLVFYFMIIPAIVGCLLAYVKFKRRVKEINKWYDTSVEVCANIEEIDKIYKFEPRRVPYSEIKISVKFKYLGKVYLFKSGQDSNGKRFVGQYQRIYKKFIGKNTLVLFSEKYNQVLFTKHAVE